LNTGIAAVSDGVAQGRDELVHAAVKRYAGWSVQVMAWLAIGLLALPAGAQVSFERRPVTNEAWLQPFPAHRIIGDVYYVGTYDLAAFLITTPAGHILINTGVYDSADMIRTSMETLGFDFDDIEIVLTTQAHWDHVADIAEIKRRTGARFFAHEGDVPVLEDGGNTDFRFPEGRGVIFEPVTVDRVLQHGDTIELGGTVLTLHHHPGHTKGASSFTFDTEDGGRTYSVLVVNMASINAGVELLNSPGYPEIAADYAATFAAQKALSADVWVSSHGRHFDLYDKFTPGDSYDPQRFIDPQGYRAKIEEYEQLYLTQLEAERAQQTH